MSNEVKVGILAVVAIALSYWGYKFIMGNNVLLKSNTYKVYYQKVGRMQVGTQVFINGVSVGSVASVELLNDVDRTVEVILDLKPGMTIPQDTKATIVATGFMGGKAVLLEYDNPCSGDDCADPGDTLEGEYRGLLGSMVGEESMKDYVGILQRGLEDLIDTLNYALLSEESDSPIAKSMRDLEATLSNLNSTTGQLDRIVRRSAGSIEGSLENVEAITGNLKRNNDKIASILSNVDSLSADLVAADLQQTITEVKGGLEQLNSTLASADQAIGGVSALIDDLEQGEGTLGKLLKDEALYQDLSEMTQQVDSFLYDFENRPYRYMPFKTRRQINRYDRKDSKED